MFERFTDVPVECSYRAGEARDLNHAFIGTETSARTDP